MSMHFTMEECMRLSRLDGCCVASRVPSQCRYEARPATTMATAAVPAVLVSLGRDQAFTMSWYAWSFGCASTYTVSLLAISFWACSLGPDILRVEIQVLAEGAAYLDSELVSSCTCRILSILACSSGSRFGAMSLRYWMSSSSSNALTMSRRTLFCLPSGDSNGRLDVGSPGAGELGLGRYDGVVMPPVKLRSISSSTAGGWGCSGGGG